jgi:hypothetical protein
MEVGGISFPNFWKAYLPLKAVALFPDDFQANKQNFKI